MPMDWNMDKKEQVRDPAHRAAIRSIAKVVLADNGFAAKMAQPSFMRNRLHEELALCQYVEELEAQLSAIKEIVNGGKDKEQTGGYSHVADVPEGNNRPDAGAIQAEGVTN